MDKLPVFELTINPEQDSLVDVISIVDQPAIMSDFMAFSNQQKQYFAANDEKMELLGAAMIPDMKIFRKAPNGSGFYVFFSKDTIRQIAQEFFKNGFQKNMNIEHSAKAADSYVFQSYIIDEYNSSPKGMELPEGTWVVGVKVENPQVWQDIKAGKQHGFSVEGIFEKLDARMSEQQTKDEEEVLDVLKQINQILRKLNN